MLGGRPAKRHIPDPRRPEGGDGFTLLELLIGLAVFALLMLAVVPVLQQMTGQGQAQARGGSAAVAGTIALRQINAAVRQASGVVCVENNCMSGYSVSGAAPEVTLEEPWSFPVCKPIKSNSSGDSCLVTYSLNANGQVTETSFVTSTQTGLVAAVLNLVVTVLVDLLANPPHYPSPHYSQVLAQGVASLSFTDVNNCLADYGPCLIRETLQMNAPSGHPVSLQGEAFMRDNRAQFENPNNGCGGLINWLISTLLFGNAHPPSPC